MFYLDLTSVRSKFQVKQISSCLFRLRTFYNFPDFYTSGAQLLVMPSRVCSGSKLPPACPQPGDITIYTAVHPQVL